MRKASEQQPQPVGTGEIVLHEVVKDIQDRAEVGTQKYGTLLRTHNGRDPLMDAYQEALDLVMYLKQALMEREEINNV